MTLQALASADIRALRASILWLVSSVGAAHALTFLSAPLLIALYTPQSFGSFALLSVAATMIGNVSAARFERAIVLTTSDDDAKLILRACLGSNVLAGGALFLALAGLSHFEQGIVIRPMLVVLAALLVATFGAGQTLSHWLTRQKQFQRLALADFCSTLVMLACQIALGLSGRASAESLLGGMLIGRLASLVMVPRAAGSLTFTESRRISDLRRLLIQYRTLALFSTPNAVLAALQFRALLFVVAHFSGLAAAGQLAIAYRLTYVPATALGMALRRVFFPTFSRALQERSTNELTLAVLTFLGIVVPPAVIVGSLLVSAYGGILPGEWQNARVYVQCLLPIAAILVFTSWFDQVYDVLHLQRTALLLESGSSLIGVGLFCLMSAAGASTVAALAAYSIWTFVYNIGWLRITWQLTGWPQMQFLRVLVAASAYTLIMCLAFAVGGFSLPLAIVLLTGGLLAAWRYFPNISWWLANHDDFACKKVA